jgi:thiamine-monophosphate kinase
MLKDKKEPTKLSDLGEFALIEYLTKNIKLKNKSSKYGVGDDAAVVKTSKTQVVTTDILTEGIHFDFTYTPAKHLGYKSAVVNFSDIYAMNAMPKQMLVSIAVSSKISLEIINDFYEGLYLACERYGVDLVGGDTTSSLTGMTISITVIGEANAKDIVYRNGAKETDIICVTGDLGGAYMGLQ